jgi:glycosyltransferase involved in cell wall biosynthesis
MRVHLVEPGGRGGVYQHTVAVAERLSTAGVEVHVHTAADPEPLPVEGAFRSHVCLWRLTGLRRRWLRQVVLAVGWLSVGIPGCVWRVRRGDVVHVQGRFRPTLLLPLFALLRTRRCTLVWSPHTTFTRTGQAAERVVQWMARRVHLVATFTEWDRRRLEEWGTKAMLVPYAFLAPSPTAEAVAWWRRRWVGAEEGRIVLFAGHVRADKGLDLLVRAAAAWPEGTTLAVVGEDAGALAEARRLASELGVPVVWDSAYQPLERFVAAVAAADVVVCPYRVSSQSGVLALARALGRPTVVTDVGALPEMADVVVPPQDVQALASAIESALEGLEHGDDAVGWPGLVGTVPPSGDDGEGTSTADAYLKAYVQAAQPRSGPEPFARPYRRSAASR